MSGEEKTATVVPRLVLDREFYHERGPLPPASRSW